jgi:hypothetical protein
MVLRGCRRAELCGFRWSYADLDRGVLTVKRPILQLGGKLHEEATAKSKAGDRLGRVELTDPFLVSRTGDADRGWRPREWCMAPSDRFITFSQLSIGLAA